MKIEVKKIGNSTGVILPKELLARLHSHVTVEVEPCQPKKRLSAA